MSVDLMTLIKSGRDRTLKDFHSPLLAFVRLTGLFVFMMVSMGIQFIFLKTSRKWASRYPCYVARIVLKIMGIKVGMEGTPSSIKPTLFISNHISYLDMVIISSVIEGCYISKAEVAHWPGVGTIARLIRTIFIDRRPQFAVKQRNEVLERLAGKDNIIMFAEGTTSDGTRVLPFKSSIIGVAEDGQFKDLPIQPIALAYVALDDIPMGRHFRPFYAWYGDMGFFSHLWQWAGLGKITVNIFFHKPVTVDEFHNRKKIADYCQQAIQLSLAGAYSSQSQNLLIASEKKRRLPKFIKKRKK